MVVYQKVIRAFDIIQPLDIYRVVGRRPSDVWVDAEHRIGQEGPGSQPLKELVYWHSQAVPGESIQERVGGIFIVMVNGDSHPISLSMPTAIEPGTAFLHAQSV